MSTHNDNKNMEAMSINIESIYSKIWHSLNNLQQLELILAKNNITIDMERDLQLLEEVLQTIRPGGKLPSVYVEEDEEELVLE